MGRIFVFDIWGAYFWGAYYRNFTIFEEIIYSGIPISRTLDFSNQFLFPLDVRENRILWFLNFR